MNTTLGHTGLPDLPQWSSRSVVGAGLIGLVVAHFVTSTVMQYLRLRHIKGPPVAGISILWYLRVLLRGKMHLETLAINEKYGPLARIGPNDVLVSDPDMVKQIQAVGSKYVRSYWYDATRFDPFRDHVLSMRNEAEHNARRPQLAPGYSGRGITGLDQFMDEIISQLMALLDDYTARGQRLDLVRKLQYFTIDLITRAAFGAPFGFMAKDEDINGYIQTTESFAAVLGLATVFPFINNIRRSRLFAALLPMKKMAAGHVEIMNKARDTAADRFIPGRMVQQDMAGSFIAHGLNQEQLEGELALTLLAGSETTAHVLRNTLLHVISNPVVLAKLRAEIDSTAAALPPSESGSSVPFASAQKLPYLQAVIREGIRILPPVSGGFAKESPPGGARIEDTFLPGGTRLHINFWGLTRQKRIWGDDVEEFRPERWLLDETDPASKERLKEMTVVGDMSFSYGKWQCLGKGLAQKVLAKSIFEIVRQFELTLCNPLQPMKSSNHFTFNQSDFWVRAKRRR